MKSSAVTLVHSGGGRDFLVNLIDSPGHVDFSSEVSTAVRLCDGAVIVVDAVEGVRPQTKAVLAQAYGEGLGMVLVINKVDRLAAETGLGAAEAHQRLRAVLEQVNAVIGELFAADVMGAEGNVDHAKEEKEKKKQEEGEGEVFDWSSGLEEADDSELYFAPERGNVLFASAYDGWAFDLSTFARIYSQRLGFSEAVLRKTLWGDFYVNSKTKRILRGAQDKGKKTLFVQLCLENVWAVYEAAVRNDRERLQKIVDSLGVKVAPRDLRSGDGRTQAGAVLSQWLPLAPALLSAACASLPAPNQLTAERVERLMCSSGGRRRFDTLPSETQALKEAFLKCSSGEDAPVIALVSKMFPVPKKALPKNRPKPLTQEEMAERRERARRKIDSKKVRVGMQTTYIHQ